MSYIAKRKFAVALALLIGAGLVVPSARADKHEKGETAVEGNGQAAEPMVTKVIPVRHVDPDKLAQLFFQYGSMVRSSSELGVITVHGPAASVADLEEAIRAVDASGQTGGEATSDVEITAYLLGATDDVENAAALPSLLNPVVAELREAFPYGDYHLLETFTLRIRSGKGARVSGVISNSGEARNPTYSFDVNIGSISRIGDRRVIPLEPVNLSTEWPPENPNQNRWLNAHISSGVTIQDDQTVVIGKAGLSGKNRGLFLIIKARVAE